MRKHILLIIALCMHIAARGQTIASLDDIDLSGLPKATKAKALRYWIDDDAGGVKTVGLQTGRQSLDVSALAEGLHTLHYQVVDNTDAVSPTVSSVFMKLDSQEAEAVTARKLLYWFDDDSNMKTVDVGQGIQLLDASDLADGLHTVHYQVLCSNGQMTSTKSSLFLRVNYDAGATTAKSFRYWFDEGQAAKETAFAGGVQTLDVSTLMEGLHTVHYQVVDNGGHLGTTVSAIFLKMGPQLAGTKARSIRYWIDDEDAPKVMDVSKGSQTLDVSALPTGLHTLHYQVVDNAGQLGTTVSRMFMKIFDKVVADGQNRVVKYQYWLNSNSQAMQTVTLGSAPNPYQLISLLPMPKEPIHSDCFHFEMTNGKPTVYAKNVLHVRFHDAAGYFSDGDRPFVDYSVKQEVTDAELLNNGDHKDTARPVGNDIKWYRLTAEPGDSVQFRLDRAATVQLFAPSGEEILDASASDVVKWFGCHVRESGTYYVALHDVTATSGTTVGIDYEHIDKYAVLRQDVNLVGNGGKSTITFEGNGFNELKEVCLNMGGNSIKALDITHSSNATTSVTFDFNNAMLGHYKAEFRFVDGIVTIENCIKVEVATEFEFDVNATYASSFLFSTGNDYTFKIHNRGNMTAYDVPLVPLIYLPDSSSLTKVDVSGYSFIDYFSDLNGGVINEKLAEKQKKFGDKCFFIGVDSTTHINGFPYIYYSFILETLPPNSSKTITISVRTTDNVYVYLDYPEIWPEQLSDDTDNTRPLRSPRRVSSLCSVAQNDLAQCYLYRMNIDLTGENEALERKCQRKLPKNCPPPYLPGGPSTPVASMDPNDIFGYTAESGSHAVKDGLTDVYYRIEFENDTAFATAPAHDIYVTDTLDASKFDLSTFKPTRVRIGEKSAELTGDKNFVTTIDMRPGINAIAQVEGTYDEKKGIAKWHISSLDPMTMEPTKYVQDGVLPVNIDGRGIGEVMYDISLKPALAHGTEIKNRAGIVFDTNDVIMTPTWTNTIDRVRPVSRVVNAELLPGGNEAAISIEASDEGSGSWRYDVYVQYGSGAWFLAAEGVSADTTATVKLYDGIVHRFYSVATDKAGNVEAKEAHAELTLTISERQKGDVNGDGHVDVADIASVITVMAGGSGLPTAAADVNGDGQVDVADIATIITVMAELARMQAAVEE